MAARSRTRVRKPGGLGERTVSHPRRIDVTKATADNTRSSPGCRDMARCLFTVEDTFLIEGRGLVPVPGIAPQGDERFRVGDPIKLKRPDGSEMVRRIAGLELLCPRPRPDDVVILLKGLGKDDVPVGTEVWSVDKHACPCCGYKTLSATRAYDLCYVCFWEDDPVQYADPDYEGGVNDVSLRLAQRNFREFGASEVRAKESVRAPRGDEERDPGWQPLGPPS